VAFDFFRQWGRAENRMTCYSGISFADGFKGFDFPEKLVLLAEWLSAKCRLL
jgi:hypothetical protein